MNSKHLSKGASLPPPVAKGKVRLYSNRFCPYVQRVILVLDVKKIPYEIININLLNKPDWLYEKNPNGKVPSLELDSGDVLHESTIIADYLDEKYPQHKLHSKDPLVKAKDQILLKDFNKIINAMFKTVLLGRIDSDDADAMTEGLEIFENDLSNRKGPFFGGNKPGMLDYMIWPWCERSDLLKLFGKEIVFRKDKYKNILEWKNRMFEDEAVKKSCLDLDTHIQYFHAYRAGVVDYDYIINSIKY